MKKKGRNEGNVVKGLASGLVAGVAATAVMTAFQNTWQKSAETFGAREKDSEGHEEEHSGSQPKRAGKTTRGKGKQGNGHTAQAASHPSDTSQSNQSNGHESNGQDKGNPTEEVAELIAGSVFKHTLKETERKSAGEMVHYGFGTLLGAGYGVMAETMPVSTAGLGTLYGTAVWLGADEVVLPATKLSKMPTEYPLSTHTYGFAAHLVYSVTLELVRRVVRGVL